MTERRPQNARKNITEAQLESALRKHAGVMMLAARELGCSRENVAGRVRHSPRLQKALEEIDSEVGDLCEGVIVDALLQRDKQMARWYAAHKLRSRGYVTRTEMANPDGTALNLPPPVTINVHYVGAIGPDDDVI